MAGSILRAPLRPPSPFVIKLPELLLLGYLLSIDLYADIDGLDSAGMGRLLSPGILLHTSRPRFFSDRAIAVYHLHGHCMMPPPAYFHLRHLPMRWFRIMVVIGRDGVKRGPRRSFRRHG